MHQTGALVSSSLQRYSVENISPCHASQIWNNKFQGKLLHLLWLLSSHPFNRWYPWVSPVSRTLQYHHSSRHKVFDFDWLTFTPVRRRRPSDILCNWYVRFPFLELTRQRRRREDPRCNYCKINSRQLSEQSSHGVCVKGRSTAYPLLHNGCLIWISSPCFSFWWMEIMGWSAATAAASMSMNDLFL